MNELPDAEITLIGCNSNKDLEKDNKELLYLNIANKIANMEEPSIEDVDMSDHEQAAIWKTVQILLNKVIYADSYLTQ